MADIRISELPTFTGDTTGAYLVMNNSTDTETFKVLKENIVSGGDSLSEEYQTLTYPIGITRGGSTYNDTTFRSLRDHVSLGTSPFTMSSNRGQFCYYQLQNGLNLTAIRINVSTAVAASTMAIGIYSMSIYTHTDGLNYYYPSTLQYTITSNLDTSTTGLKTITGLNFTVDNSLTYDNLWCIVYLPTANIGLQTFTSTSSLVRRGDFGFYETGGTTYINTAQQINLSTSTLPASFPSLTTDNPSQMGIEPWLLVRFTLP